MRVALCSEVPCFFSVNSAFDFGYASDRFSGLFVADRVSSGQSNRRLLLIIVIHPLYRKKYCQGLTDPGCRKSRQSECRAILHGARKAMRTCVSYMDYIPSIISLNVSFQDIQRDAPWVMSALSLIDEMPSMIMWIRSSCRGLRIVTDRFIQVSQLEFFMRAIR